MTSTLSPAAPAAAPFAFAGEAPDVLFGLPMPMAQALRLRGEHIGDDHAQVRMEPQSALANSRGEAHGGAIAALLDCTLASAVRAHDPAAYGVATIDLSLHFVAAGSGPLTATAHCERRGRSISFARGEVHSADGSLVALATGSFKLMARSPAA